MPGGGQLSILRGSAALPRLDWTTSLHLSRDSILSKRMLVWGTGSWNFKHLWFVSVEAAGPERQVCVSRLADLSALTSSSCWTVASTFQSICLPGFWQPTANYWSDSAYSVRLICSGRCRRSMSSTTLGSFLGRNWEGDLHANVFLN